MRRMENYGSRYLFVAVEKFCLRHPVSKLILPSIQLFNTPYFQVTVIADSVSVQICGALKNVIAVGAGLCDGLK